jgi:hypothetical protein
MKERPMTTLAKTALAAALLLAAGLGSGAASAAPATSLPGSAADSASAAALAAGRVCYPRMRWTWRPGRGPIQIIVGWICIPYLVRPPFPPTPPERIGIGPRVAY